MVLSLRVEFDVAPEGRGAQAWKVVGGARAAVGGARAAVGGGGLGRARGGPGGGGGGGGRWGGGGGWRAPRDGRGHGGETHPLTSLSSALFAS